MFPLHNVEVVLDKSYLEGKPRQVIMSLADTVSLLMTDPLFMELVTTDERRRTMCFRKFPDRDNPVALIPGIGELLQWECARKSPAVPLLQHRERFTWEFNRRIRDGTFTMTSHQRLGAHDWETQVTAVMGSFLDRALLARRLYPRLSELRPGQLQQAPPDLAHEIATNTTALRKFYSELRRESYPTAEQLDRRWTFFRYLQVELLAMADFFTRHGAAELPARPKRLFNEVVDLEILVYACLTTALASLDKPMQRRFRILCPSGLLLC